MLTSVLIGSQVLPSIGFDVVVGATTESFVLPADRWYVDYHLGGAPSLVHQVAQQVQNHSLVTAATGNITEGGKCRITANVAFRIVWTGSVEIRNMLGFTVFDFTTLETAHTATNQSPYVWIPQRTYSSPDAPLGCDVPVLDTMAAVDAMGSSVYSEEHNEYAINTLRWTHVHQSLTWTRDENFGEFIVFWRNVLSRFNKFRLYREQTWTSGGLTSLNLTSALRMPQSAGAYQLMPPRGPVKMKMSRVIANVDLYSHIEFDVIKVDEA